MAVERCEIEKAEAALSNRSLIIHGRKFQCIKQSNGLLAFESCKPTSGSGKRDERRSFETRKSGALPAVLSGPCFRPWSRGTTDERKRLQEHRRQTNECFNSLEIVNEVTADIVKATGNQVNGGNFICLLAPCKVLRTTMQGTEMDKQSRAWGYAEAKQTWQSTQKFPHGRKDDFSNVKLLRRKLLSFYDHGPVIQPFEAIVGEKLNHKYRHSEVKVAPAFQQDIFPFAVPYLRLPLLSSSRYDLGRISQVLTKCDLFPWQLQNKTTEYTRHMRTVKPTDITIQTSTDQGIKHNLISKTEETGKTSLKVFIPTSS